MAILQSIARRLGFKATKPAVQPSYGVNTGDSYIPWTMPTTRKAMWEDLEDMDSKYGLVSRGIDAYANFATLSPDTTVPNIAVRGDARVVTIINELFERINVQDIIWSIARQAVKHADEFCELIFSDSYDIVGVKQLKRSCDINRNEDKFGNLLTGGPEAAIPRGGVAAFEQMDDAGINVIAAWYPFQIVHFRFGALNANDVYTRPLMYPALTVWKRHLAKLDVITMERLTKSFIVNVHKVPIPIRATPDEVSSKLRSYMENQYQDKIATYDTTAASFQITKRDKPATVTTDRVIPRYFTPDGKYVDSEIDVKDVTPEGLKEIADIELDIKLILATIGVPVHYLNFSLGQRAFIDKSSDRADQAFSYQVSLLQQAIIKGIREICDRQLLLKMIDPQSVKYEISLPKVVPSSTKESVDIQQTRAETAAAELAIGVPKEIVGPRTLGLSPEETKLWMAAPTVPVSVPKKKDNQDEPDDEPDDGDYDTGNEPD